MGRQWCFLVAVSFAFVSSALATQYELHCFFGNEICDQWDGNKNASHGNNNGEKFCCPPEEDQGFRITSFTITHESCFCKSGTAADYAHITTAPSMKDDGKNPASIAAPEIRLVATVLLVVTAVFL
ncbi:uncharacterized protein LOC143289865 [Babylonia areolata]|uniref:uncharacterized protein LOC143289865 n=1 Tax=Babylonia areolata TaxID=304850 RepID=UPI003FD0151C